MRRNTKDAWVMSPERRKLKVSRVGMLQCTVQMEDARSGQDGYARIVDHSRRPEAQRFAGAASYSTTIEVPANAGGHWILDLGDVRESARVRMNGKAAGVLVAHPFRLDVSGFLKTGANTIEIEVTNLSANRIRDLDRRKVEWKKFHEINIVDHNYKKFDASQWPDEPSGLLGPVTLSHMSIE